VFNVPYAVLDPIADTNEHEENEHVEPGKLKY